MSAPTFASEVMGRSAVFVSTTTLGLAGLVGFSGASTSRVVTLASGADAPIVQMAWGLLYVVGWILVIIALVLAGRDDDAALHFERVGVGLCAVGSIIFVGSAIKADTPATPLFDGSVFVVLLLTGTTVNLLGRQVVLYCGAKRLVENVSREGHL